MRVGLTLVALCFIAGMVFYFSNFFEARSGAPAEKVAMIPKSEVAEGWVYAVKPIQKNSSIRADQIEVKFVKNADSRLGALIARRHEVVHLVAVYDIEPGEILTCHNVRLPKSLPTGKDE